MSDHLKRAVADFVGAFEEVFDRDWPYSRGQLLDEDGRHIRHDGTFLNPGVDESDDWEARGQLLVAYRRLVRLMADEGIRPRSANVRRGDAMIFWVALAIVTAMLIGFFASLAIFGR